MKKVFQILGFVLLGILVFVLGVVGYLYFFTDAFNTKLKPLDELSLTLVDDLPEYSIGDDETVYMVQDDFRLRVDFAPEDAVGNVVNLNVPFGKESVEIPSQVKVGETFKVHIKDTYANFGGTVRISATDQSSLNKANDFIFVIDRYPTELNFTLGTKALTENEAFIDYSDSNTTTLAITTNPVNALNPNYNATNLSPELFNKHIWLLNSDDSVISIEGLDYTTQSSEYKTTANFALKTLQKGTSTLSAYMFPGYIMYQDFIASGYTTEGTFPADTCSAFINKYIDYIRSNTHTYRLSDNTEKTGEEFANAITQNGANQVSFTTSQRTLFEDALRYLLLSKSVTLSVSMGNIQSLTLTSDTVDFNLFEDKVFTLDQLKSIFGLKVSLPNNEQVTDDILKNVEITPLLVNKNGSERQFEFQGYRTGLDMANFVKMLNSAGNGDDDRLNWSTNNGQSGVFAPLKPTTSTTDLGNDSMHYTFRQISNLVQDGLLSVTKSNDRWTISSYDEIPDGCELYLHFSIQTIVERSGENIDIIFEDVVKVNVHAINPLASNIQTHTNLPEYFVTNGRSVSINGQNALNHFEVTDFASLDRNDYSFKTIKYLVKADSISNGSNAGIPAIRVEQSGADYKKHMINGEEYYEIYGSSNGTLSIQAMNVSPFNITTTGIQYTKAYILIAVIKTDKLGQPRLQGDGSYELVTYNNQSVQTEVRSYSEDYYYYTTDSQGKYILHNRSLSDISSLYTYNNTLVKMNSNSQTATYYDPTYAGEALDYSEVMRDGTQFIGVNSSIRAMVGGQIDFRVTNYLMSEDGACYETSAEKAKQCASAMVLEDGTCNFEVSTSVPNIESYVNINETLEDRNNDPYVSLHVTIINMIPDSNSVMVIADDLPGVSSDPSIEIMPEYVDINTSDAIFMYQEKGVNEGGKTVTKKANGNSEADVLTLTATGNANNELQFLDKDTDVNAELDFYRGGDTEEYAFIGPLGFKINLSNLVGTDEDYKATFESQTVASWKVEHSSSLNGKFEEDNVATGSYLRITTAQGQGGGYSFTVIAGADQGEYIRLTLTLYSYEDSTTGYQFNNKTYHFKHEFVTYIKIVQQDPQFILKNSDGSTENNESHPQEIGTDRRFSLVKADNSPIFVSFSEDDSVSITSSVVASIPTEFEDIMWFEVTNAARAATDRVWTTTLSVNTTLVFVSTVSEYSNAYISLSVLNKTEQYHFDIKPDIQISLQDAITDAGTQYSATVTGSGEQGGDAGKLNLSDNITVTPLAAGASLASDSELTFTLESESPYFALGQEEGKTVFYYGVVSSPVVARINMYYSGNQINKQLFVTINPPVTVTTVGNYSSSSRYELKQGLEHEVLLQNAEPSVTTSLAHYATYTGTVTPTLVPDVSNSNLTVNANKVKYNLSKESIDVTFDIKMNVYTLVQEGEKYVLSAPTATTLKTIYYTFAPRVTFDTTEGKEETNPLEYVNESENLVDGEDYVASETTVSGLTFKITGTDTDVTETIFNDSDITFATKTGSEWVEVAEPSLTLSYNSGIKLTATRSVNSDTTYKCTITYNSEIIGTLYITHKADVIVECKYPIFADHENIAPSTQVDLTSAFGKTASRILTKNNNGKEYEYELTAYEDESLSVTSSAVDIVGTKFTVHSGTANGKNLYIKVGLKHIGVYAVYHIVVVTTPSTLSTQYTGQVYANYPMTTNDLLGEMTHQTAKYMIVTGENASDFHIVGEEEGKELYFLSTSDSQNFYFTEKYNTYTLEILLFNDSSTNTEASKLVLTVNMNVNFTLGMNSIYALKGYNLLDEIINLQSYSNSVVTDLDESAYTYTVSSSNPDASITDAEGVKTLRFNKPVTDSDSQTISIVVMRGEQTIATLNVSVMMPVTNIFENGRTLYGSANGVDITTLSNPTSLMDETNDWTISYEYAFTDKTEDGRFKVEENKITYPATNAAYEFTLSITVKWTKNNATEVAGDGAETVTHTQSKTYRVEPNIGSYETRNNNANIARNAKYNVYYTYDNNRRVVLYFVTGDSVTADLFASAPKLTIFTARNTSTIDSTYIDLTGNSSKEYRVEQLETEKVEGDNVAYYPVCTLVTYNGANSGNVELSYTISFEKESQNPINVPASMKFTLNFTSGSIDSIAKTAEDVKIDFTSAETGDSNAKNGIALGSLIKIGDKTDADLYRSVVIKENDAVSTKFVVIYKDDIPYLFAPWSSSEDTKFTITIYPFDGATQSVVFDNIQLHDGKLSFKNDEISLNSQNGGRLTVTDYLGYARNAEGNEFYDTIPDNVQIVFMSTNKPDLIKAEDISRTELDFSEFYNNSSDGETAQVVLVLRDGLDTVQVTLNLKVEKVSAAAERAD